MSDLENVGLCLASCSVIGDIRWNSMQGANLHSTTELLISQTYEVAISFSILWALL